MARRKLTNDLILEIAKSFSTVTSFQRADGSAYKAARERGILEEACNHMQRAHRSFSDSDLESIAALYQNRQDFRNMDKGAYHAALKRGLLEKVCAHMPRIQGQWTKARITELAKEFKTRRSFQLAHPSAYSAAQRLKCVDEICVHMESPLRTLDKDTVVRIAMSFETRRDFALADASAYQAVLKNNWQNEAFSHMRRGYGGFNEDKKAYLYQIEFLLPNGFKVWKVGITNRKPETRLKYMGIPDWAMHRITHAILYEKGSEARSEEIRLHAIGASLGIGYDGDPFLRNGNTELFLAPLIKD